MHMKFGDLIFRLVLFFVLMCAPAWAATVEPLGASSGEVPWTVTFLSDNHGSCVPQSFSWYFGEGTPVNGTTPMQAHTFNTPGYYTVTCFVEYTNASGCNGTRAEADVVAYRNGYALLDSVTATPSSGSSPLDVEFSCTTFGQVSSYSWDFGDGTTGTGSTVNHTYDICGKYEAACTVEDADGHRESKTVTVSVGGELISSLAANPGTGPAPLRVYFSCVPLVSESLDYTWTFGDGNSVSGRNRSSVSNTYSVPGTYNATCRVENDHGCIDIKTVAVVVRSGKSDLIAQLTADPEQGDPPLSVVFTCRPHDPMQIEKYEWDFGDGTIRDGAAVESHQYTDVGVYVAKCRVFDFRDNWDEDTVVIRVGQPEVAVTGSWRVFGGEITSQGGLTKMYSGSWTMTPNGDLSNSHLRMIDTDIVKSVTGNVYLDVWKNLGGYFRTDSSHVRVQSGTVCSDNQVGQLFGRFLQGTTLTHMEHIFLVRSDATRVFTPGDLTEYWHYFLWQAGPGSQATFGGYIRLGNTGQVREGTRWNQGQIDLASDGTLQGRLTGPGLSDTLKTGVMSGNKDVMVWLLDNGSNGYGLAVLVKGGSAHSQSEMAHPWYLSRVSSPQWGSSLEYAVVEPDLYGIPSTGRFRAVDGLSCGTWKSGQLSLLGSGHMYGYLTDENDNQADVLYGQMGSGKKMAGIWTGDDFGLQTVTILMDPPQGWQAPDMNCTDDDGGNSTDGGGGGGGGCVMDPEASGGGTWALAGMLLLIFLISRRNLLN